MSITYKKLKPIDSEQYRKIRLEALEEYPEHFGSGYYEKANLPKLYFQRLIEEESSQGFMVGAFEKTDLVGICGITFETKLLDSSGKIVQMYVTKNHQRKGK